MPALHFISGLPRSGSTLLAAILGQNPRFQAGMSGKQRQSVLPPDIFRRFENDAFWRDPAQRRAGLAVI